jgi:hypothetical protein
MKPKNYHFHKSPWPVPILDLINPVLPPSHSLKIHFNIVLPSKTRSSKWTLSCRFPHLKPVYTSPLPHSCYMSHPDHINLSLPCSSEPTTCPHPKPNQSSPCPPSHFLKIRCNLILPSRPRSYKWTLSLRSHCQKPVCTFPIPHYPLTIMLSTINFLGRWMQNYDGIKCKEVQNITYVI